jgi:glycosyltransferase involved in cell wall biosynthesis
MHAYLRLVSAGTRRAAQVIADSGCSRRDAIRLLGLDPDRVTAIPLAVGPEFQPTPDTGAVDAIRARLGLDGKRVIFNVAGLDVRKNVATLLRAFARATDRIGQDVTLVIGGKAHGNPGLYPDLAPLTRELGIAERALFPGALSAGEKIALYHLADCYAAPSRYEGFGLTPLEAMACGTPVVAADASCTPEVVGDAALLVGPDDVAGFADALARVVTDATLAARLRQAGLRQAARFSWQRTALATLAIYERACTLQADGPRPLREQSIEVTQ